MTKKSQGTSGDDEGGTSRLVNTGLREIMLERLDKKELRRGEMLYRRGDRVDGFFLVQAGTLDVLRDGEVVRTLQVGDLVGERQYFEESDKRLQCTKPRNETVMADSDAVLSHLTASQLNMVILNSTEAGIKILHHYAKLALQAEDRAAVNQHANKDLAKAASTAEREAADANQKLGKARAEISQLKERNEGQAASLAKLNDENARLEQAARDLETELAGLRSDLADGARKIEVTEKELSDTRGTLVASEQLKHQATRLMQEQFQRAEAAEADLARATEALGEANIRARGLAEELVGAKMDLEDAQRQLGDEQRAKVATQAALYELEQAVEKRVEAAYDAQAALYAEYCARQDTAIKALRLRNNELRDERNQLRGTRVGTHNMSRQDIDLSEILSGLEEIKAKMRPVVLPIPLDATAHDVTPIAVTFDPPSDTQPNAAISEPPEGEPALILNLDTFVGKPPTKPKATPEPVAPQANRFDEPTGRIGLDDIEVIVGSIPPPKPE